jgi:hypothetical protein
MNGIARSILILLLSISAHAATPCEENDPFQPVWEADVFPLASEAYNGGDGEIRFLDWSIILSRATKASPILSPCDFMVTDCAPRATLGDGVIDVADVYQAYRFSFDLDGGPAIAGGPAGPLAQTFAGQVNMKLAKTPDPNFFALQIVGTERVGAVLCGLKYDTNCLRFKGSYPLVYLNRSTSTNSGSVLFWATLPPLASLHWGARTCMLEFERLNPDCGAMPAIDPSAFPPSVADETATPLKVTYVTEPVDQMEPLEVTMTLVRGVGVVVEATPAPFQNVYYETSVDLLTWTSATNSGTFDKARFFRFR